MAGFDALGIAVPLPWRIDSPLRRSKTRPSSVEPSPTMADFDPLTPLRASAPCRSRRCARSSTHSVQRVFLEGGMQSCS